MTVAEQGDMSQSMIFSSANCSFGNSRDSAGLPHSRPFRIRHDCVEGEHGGSLPFCFADTLIPATDAVSDTSLQNGLEQTACHVYKKTTADV